MTFFVWSRFIENNFMRRLLFTFFFTLNLASISLAQGFGEPSAIRSVYFRGGSYYVDRAQSTELQHFLDSIPNIHNYVITVHSHTDNVGGKEYNEWLSEMRSESVIEELVLNEKVKKEVIEKKDFGLFNP
ncbi:MAG TPA: OmpA family protein, partial [Roseivirga sp.]